MNKKARVSRKLTWFVNIILTLSIINLFFPWLVYTDKATMEVVHMTGLEFLIKFRFIHILVLLAILKIQGWITLAHPTSWTKIALRFMVVFSFILFFEPYLTLEEFVMGTITYHFIIGFMMLASTVLASLWLPASELAGLVKFIKNSFIRVVS